MNFVFAGVLVVTGNFIAGIIFALFALFYVWFAWSVRDRIPFAALMLETVCGITRKYNGTVISGILGLIVGCLFFALWFVAVTLSEIVFTFRAFILTHSFARPLDH
jgi:hypothetical protein